MFSVFVFVCLFTTGGLLWGQDVQAQEFTLTPWELVPGTVLYQDINAGHCSLQMFPGIFLRSPVPKGAISEMKLLPGLRRYFPRHSFLPGLKSINR